MRYYDKKGIVYENDVSGVDSAMIRAYPMGKRGPGGPGWVTPPNTPKNKKEHITGIFVVIVCVIGDAR